MSKVTTEEEFRTFFPLYTLDLTSPFVVPAPISRDAMKILIESFAANLVSCTRSVQVDNESSRYPFLYEILRSTLHFSDENQSITMIEKVLLPSIDTIEEFVEGEEIRRSFVSKDGLSAQNDDEDDETTLKEVLMRWERYYAASGEPNGGWFGFVEFVVENAQHFTRLLLECKRDLDLTNKPVTDAIGFWQTLAELAEAKEHNLAMAEAKAAAAEIANVAAAQETAGPKKKAVRKKAKGAAEPDTASAPSVPNPVAAAVAAENEVPVYSALTDFYCWIFFRVDAKKRIIVSSAIDMFRFENQELLSSSKIYDGLGYLCLAMGITADLPQMQRTKARIDAHNSRLTDAFKNSIYGAETLAAEQYVQGLVQGLKDAGLGAEQISAILKKKYPDGIPKAKI